MPDAPVAAPEQRTIDVDVRDLDTRGRTLHGYAAVYHAESGDLGGFTERIAPGAFAGVLADSPDVRALVNHDPSQVLGRTRSGTLRLEDDERGLRFEIDLPDSPLGENVRTAVGRGDIDGASFRFRVGRDSWEGRTRTVEDIAELPEITIATYGAYPSASVELRTRNPQEATVPENNPGGGSLAVEDRARIAASPTAETRTSVTLAPEDRMIDWRAQRGRSTFSADEAREFNLGRAVRGMVTGAWDDADLERRALAEGVGSTGGFVVPEVVSAQVIDRIRNVGRIFEAGATVVPMASDQVSIPRLAAGVQAQWKVENAPIVESDPAFERVTLTARTLPVLTRISLELFEDMSAAASDRIQEELVAAIALELDRAALRGSGVAPVPLGLRNQPGVEIRSLGANGAALGNYTELVRAVAALRGRNVQPNAAIFSARTAESLALLADTTGQPLNPPAYLSGLALLESNQVANNLAQGTSTDTSEIYVGRWPELLVGVRPSIGVRVRTLGERYMDQLQVGLVAWLRADVALAHPESFNVITGVRS